METQVTVIDQGHIRLTPEIQEALCLPDGTLVRLTLERNGIIVQPLVPDPIKAMQDLFIGADYSLEDDLMQMRREEEEHSRRKYGC